MVASSGRKLPRLRSASTLARPAFGFPVAATRATDAPCPSRTIRMSQDVLLWLLTAEATGVLADTANAVVDPAAVVALRKRLSTGPEAAEKARAVFELVELRHRAAVKFPQAERMFFTRKAYEQATDAVVARYKAQRFAHCSRVVDACCGIGGDLIGLADVVPESLGVDSDPVLAKYAERNVHLDGGSAQVVTQLLDDQNLPECDAWHVDPDRRPAGRRTTDPEAHQPSLETLNAWCRRTPAGAVKLAPAAQLPKAWNANAELEWISHRGECRQLVAWTGSLAGQPGLRRATRLFEGRPVASIVGDPEEAIPLAASVEEWIYEPDPAVLAAKLQGSLARQHDVTAVAPGIAYFTSSQQVSDDLLATFRVLETMPLDRKRLAAWLSTRDVGRLEIKVRGTDIRPEVLRKTLKPKGENEATLLIYSDAEQRTQVVITQREAPLKTAVTGNAK